ncbi:hypothetical protein Leryth_022227 [Lithospermum erythrorhizon]|nr:hypothetical protein Leryth_022227 [Lithospermum erythrorhizon]
MGQVAKRSKKGRPSKADLAAEEREVRRSGRRRNVRYTFDFDDYLDDDEYFFVEEEADERRREKKIKLLLKLHSGGATRDSPYLRRKGMELLAKDDSDGDDDDDNCAKKQNLIDDGGGGDKGSKKQKLINGGIDDDDDGGGGDNCKKKRKLINMGSDGGGDDKGLKKRKLVNGGIDVDDDGGGGDYLRKKRKLINGEIGGDNGKKKGKLINGKIDDKGSKKWKLINGEIDDEENGIDSGKEEEEEDEEIVEGDDDCGLINEDDEVKGEKREEGTSEVDYALGTPTKLPSECPLPDEKILELILLCTLMGVTFVSYCRKDIYGVYAEPVDPEELPDYHDLIENPMDFSTIRSKLSNGSYATLEQFESDVFLLCSNAMQYNEPDTVYYKQARSIQDLAKRKFQKLRIDHERLENQVKSEPEPKTKSVSVLKKQIRRQTNRTLQEPMCSDFLTDSTPAIVTKTQNGSNEMQTGVAEKASSLDVLDEGNHFVIDTSVDKLRESLAGRDPLPGFGRNVPPQDENRAGATYSIGGQPNASCPSSDSAFSPFDGETKQLIPVGLHVEHAYARSLARFAGSLGHVAWRIASKRIEQILPPGTKFGHGWVREYEPLPTPVVIPDNRIESDFFANPQRIDNPSKQKMLTNPVASMDSCISGPPLEGKLPFPNPALLEVTTSSSRNSFGDQPSVKESGLKGKSSFSCSNGTTISGSSISQLMHPSTCQINSLLESSRKVVKPVELIGSFSGNHNSPQLAMERCFFNNAEAPTPRSAEMVSVNGSPLPSAAFKQSNTSGVAFGSLQTDKRLLNGRAINCAAVDSKQPPLCSEMNKSGPHISHGQELALCDPVQLMKMLSENNRNQQNLANQSPYGFPSVPSVVQSLNRDDSSHAAAGVNGSWMSMGSGGLRPTVFNMGLQRNQIPTESLYNATLAQQSQFSRFRGDFPAPVNFQPGKNNYPFHGVSSQPVRVGTAVQFQNQSIVVPQLSPADLSRLQVQSPWRNVGPHTQQAHKQGTCPPDLNVSFHSTGSPGRPSPGVVVESRPPDLALQL